MTRIIEHRQDATLGDELFELRVFQLRDGDVRACVVPADLSGPALVWRAPALALRKRP